tara:strand:+ start:4297 stop:5121 length:825 start_codon:yes stop_codon:yes gene_type:complete
MNHNDYEQIKYEVANGVATLTLNRPDRMNAWTRQMHRELTNAIEASNASPDVGAMVITGAGRGFCAGADIKDTFQKQIVTSAAPQPKAENTGQSSDWVALLRRSKPIIAAVNGPSVGVGATMILPCDIIIAAESAKFAMAFVKMGVVPELASSHFLVQRMGFGRASEMCLTGRLYAAAEAFDMGLVDRLVSDDVLLSQARSTAAEIAANPPPHLRWVKELLTANGSETDLKAVQQREMDLLQKAYVSPEHKEAVAAFIEKRKPDYRRAAQESAS